VFLRRFDAIACDEVPIIVDREILDAGAFIVDPSIVVLGVGKALLREGEL